MPSGASIANVLGGINFGDSGAKMYLNTYGSSGSGDVSQVQLTTTTQGLVLGSGSFASTDVGKRIVGNGGDVILTSTGGAFSTTGGSAFTDNSTIAAGSWQMFGLKSAGDADGITISGDATSGNYTALDTTDGHTHKVTLGNTDASGNQGFTIDPNGLYLFAVDSSTDHIRRYDFGTAWDLSTLNTTMTSGQQVNHNSRDAGPVDVAFNSSGTKMFVAGQDNDRIYQWNLSTAWDLSTASYYDNHSVSGSNYVNGGFNGIFVTPNDASIYTVCRNTDRVAKWNFSASGHINGISIDGTVSVSSQNSYPFDVAWSPDGSAMYLSGNNNGFYKYNPAGNYSLSGISHDSSFSVTVGSNAVESFFIKPDETKVYTMYNNEISEWNIGTVTQPTAQYHVGVTNNGGRIDSSNFVDINSMTAAQSAGTGTVHYAVSTDGRTTWSVAKGTDGVRPIVRNNSGTWQYNNHAGAVTGNAIANASYVGTGTFSDTTDTSEIQWINSGNSLLALDNASPDRVEKYNASTAYDITTLTYSQSLGVGSYEIYLTSMHMSPDGMKLYVAGNQNNEFIQYNLTTAFDLSTASFYSTLSFANFGAMWFKPDGTKAFAMNFTNSSVTTFNMSTAWHITGATNAGSHTLQNHGTGGAGAMVWSDDGLNLYVSFPSSDTVKHYTIGTAWDVSTASASPNSMSYASQSSNMTGLAFNSDFTEMHTASGANYYRYSTTQSAYATTATWVDGTTNDELYTLQQALGAQAFNRMDKTQLDAIPDANHFTLGNSLDLMIALRMDTAASTLPTSDGVTLNYDAAALNEGAVLGTDYDFFHPSANKVQIKSLAAQNLKIRVV